MLKKITQLAAYHKFPIYYIAIRGCSVSPEWLAIVMEFPPKGSIFKTLRKTAKPCVLDGV
jgi:hypothetical protein